MKDRIIDWEYIKIKNETFVVYIKNFNKYCWTLVTLVVWGSGKRIKTYWKTNKRLEKIWIKI